MKKTIDLYEFRDDMMSIRPDNFSYMGLEVLFNYLEEYEYSCGEEMEFDPIAICCDFSEDSIQGIVEAYAIQIGDDIEEIIEYLEERTIVLRVCDDRLIIQNY